MVKWQGKVTSPPGNVQRARWHFCEPWLCICTLEWIDSISFFFHSVYVYVVAFIWFYPVLWESIADFLPLQSDQWRPRGPECWRYTRKVFSVNSISISSYNNDIRHGNIWSSCLYLVCSVTSSHTCRLVRYTLHQVMLFTLFKSQTFNVVSINPDSISTDKC